MRNAQRRNVSGWTFTKCFFIVSGQNAVRPDDVGGIESIEDDKPSHFPCKVTWHMGRRIVHVLNSELVDLSTYNHEGLKNRSPQAEVFHRAVYNYRPINPRLGIPLKIYRSWVWILIITALCNGFFSLQRFFFQWRQSVDLVTGKRLSYTGGSHGW